MFPVLRKEEAGEEEGISVSSVLTGQESHFPILNCVSISQTPATSAEKASASGPKGQRSRVKKAEQLALVPSLAFGSVSNSGYPGIPHVAKANFELLGVVFICFGDFFFFLRQDFSCVALAILELAL